MQENLPPSSSLSRHSQTYGCSQSELLKTRRRCSSAGRVGQGGCFWKLGNQSYEAKELTSSDTVTTSQPSSQRVGPALGTPGRQPRPPHGLGWRLAFGGWRFESPPNFTSRLPFCLSNCFASKDPYLRDIGGKNSSLSRLSLASFADHSSRLDLDGSRGQTPVMNPGIYVARSTPTQYLLIENIHGSNGRAAAFHLIVYGYYADIGLDNKIASITHCHGEPLLASFSCAITSAYGFASMDISCPGTLDHSEPTPLRVTVQSHCIQQLYSFSFLLLDSHSVRQIAQCSDLRAAFLISLEADRVQRPRNFRITAAHHTIQGGNTGPMALAGHMAVGSLASWTCPYGANLVFPVNRTTRSCRVTREQTRLAQTPCVSHMQLAAAGIGIFLQFQPAVPEYVCPRLRYLIYSSVHEILP
ncbi:uncharacterized protein CLUP02_10140 [Colletotrichum lupini]|uniref:Uncharacterized protein n=1 Tax=Colletotrichum lupini TaxID=145971 RepID=A0A9Q8SW18_9PEZI|nr:uncharacterized protein CLUP02_10140 [Colletotrichum lupini]UQC84644.1 hypothetical protein CLUP02_10140 [Colletotrichum lupini]